MIKTIGPNSWRGALWDEDNPRAAIIKVASNGLTGLDKQAFVKRASEETSEALIKRAKDLKWLPGEVPVHVVAMGTTEAYGPNRNGDGFSKAACMKYHNTFVTGARFYRNHKNKDPEKSYGIVKASAYNPAMSRVELIVALNSDEKTAKANGGLVADKEMEKLASGEDIAVSMACAVPYDVCSCCGNRATTREEYCKSESEGGFCKAGGLTKNLGKYASLNGELKQLYADNTEPAFFDISNVFIPADRIAYSSGMLKKASYTPSGYENEPSCMYDPGLPYEAEVMQDAISKYQVSYNTEKRASAGFLHSKPLTQLQIPGKYQLNSSLKALSDVGVCLQPAQFLQLTENMPFEKAASIGRVLGPLSNAWTQRISSEDTANNPYTAATGAPTVLYNWAFSQHQPSTDPSAWVKQAAKSCLDTTVDRKLTNKEISDAGSNGYILKLAKNYALYKIAFLKGQPAAQKEAIASMLAARDYALCVD